MEIVSRPKYVMCIDAKDTWLKEAETYAVKAIIEVNEDGNLVPKYALALNGHESILYDMGRFLVLAR